MNPRERAQYMADLQGRPWYVCTMQSQHRDTTFTTPSLEDCAGYVGLAVFKPKSNDRSR